MRCRTATVSLPSVTLSVSEGSRSSQKSLPIVIDVLVPRGTRFFAPLRMTLVVGFTRKLAERVKEPV